MKYLYLVRHAKSSWDDTALPDFERPLNERGKKDAPDMAGRLLDRNLSIDLFISSPAKRAKKTAGIFLEVYKRSKKELLLIPELYLASVPVFHRVVESIDDKYSSVALFSHNPGITEFANTLTGVRVDNMPTCSIFAVRVNSDKWKDLDGAGKEFVFFDYPKAKAG